MAGAARAWNWEAAAPADSGCGPAAGGETDGENEKRGCRSTGEDMGFSDSGLGAIVAVGLFNGRWIEGLGVWTGTMGSTTGDW